MPVELYEDSVNLQITRLEDVFKMIDKPAKGVKCDAIEGILKEGEGVLEEPRALLPLRHFGPKAIG